MKPPPLKLSPLQQKKRWTEAKINRPRARRPLSDPLPFILPRRVIARWSPRPAAPALALPGPRAAGATSIQRTPKRYISILCPVFFMLKLLIESPMVVYINALFYQGQSRRTGTSVHFDINASIHCQKNIIFLKLPLCQL